MLIFALALVLAAAATPLARRAALRFGFIDQPAQRKLHSSPIPLLGGIAIYAGVVGALLLVAGSKEILEVIGILTGATWVAVMGLWDDRRGLSASVKLFAQIVGAVILIVVGIHTRLPIPDWMDMVLTVTWVVGITNAFNLLDNMDGLSSGIGAVSAAYFLLLAALSGQYLVGAFAAALLGACIAFVYFNFNPARIFMGDAGSLFLGFLMATLGIKMRFPTNVPWVTWMVPLLVLGVPLFDTSLVFVSRLRRGLNPMTTPGKDHVSHRLVLLGWTRREAVLVLYLASCALGGVAIFVSVATAMTAYVVASTLFVLAVYAFIWLESRTGEF